MKTYRLLLPLILFVSALTLRAAEEKKTPPEWAELFGGASLPVVWQSVSAASEKIGAALTAQKLERVADWAETIHLGAHALQDQIKIGDADRAKRLTAAFEQAAKIADDVLNAANHDKIDEAADAQRRLKAALALAKVRMPRDVVDARTQEVRFAKSAGHAPDAKGAHTERNSDLSQDWTLGPQSRTGAKALLRRTHRAVGEEAARSDDGKNLSQLMAVFSAPDRDLIEDISDILLTVSPAEQKFHSSAGRLLAREDGQIPAEQEKQGQFGEFRGLGS